MRTFLFHIIRGILLVMVFVLSVPLRCSGDLGFGVVSGPDDYVQRYLNIGCTPFSKFNCNLGVNQYTSRSSPVTSIDYSFDLGFFLSRRFDMGFRIFGVPESVGYRMTGAGISGGYSNGSDTVWVYSSVAVNYSVHGLLAGPGGETWEELSQTVLAPSAGISFFDTVSLNLGAVSYLYNAGQDELTSWAASTYYPGIERNVDSLLDGFPVRSFSAGLYVNLPARCAVSADISRIEYLMGKASVEYAGFGFSHVLRSKVELTGRLSRASTGEEYLSFGARWKIP